ncbi:MAG: type pilus assembly protein PilB [Candidatus Sumerlaeota bacterium]|nr:type pilus assembly protein PilB [Candidatus Sumerlaeota bacterium]
MAYTASSSHNLGEILLREGLITQEQYDQGRRDYDTSERPLSRIFVEMGAITEGVKIGVLQKRCNCKLLTLDQIAPRPDAVALIPRRDCEKYKVVPVRIEKGELVLAMDDPTDSRTINAIEHLVERPVRPFLAKLADIENVIERLPEDEPAPEPKKAGFLLRFVSFITLPLVCFVPIGTFILALLYNREFQKAYRELEYDTFEQVLIFMLLWSAWAIIAYWIDDIIFRRVRNRS